MLTAAFSPLAKFSPALRESLSASMPRSCSSLFTISPRSRASFRSSSSVTSMRSRTNFSSDCSACGLRGGAGRVTPPRLESAPLHNSCLPPPVSFPKKLFCLSASTSLRLVSPLSSNLSCGFCFKISLSSASWFLPSGCSSRVPGSNEIGSRRISPILPPKVRMLPTRRNGAVIALTIAFLTALQTKLV